MRRRERARQRDGGRVQKLSDEQREVISLAKIAGLSRAEVARVMGRTEAAVRMLLSRSLRRYIEVMGEMGREIKWPSGPARAPRDREAWHQESAGDDRLQHRVGSAGGQESEAEGQATTGDGAADRG